MNPRRLFLFAVLCGVSGAILWFSLGLHADVSAMQTEKRRSIGATYMTMDNPFYPVIDEELRLAVESRGDVLLTRDPALDYRKQNAQIHDLIEAGVDILVVNPVDFYAITPALEEARQAGIPVVVIDSPVHDAALAACTIASDNYGAGVRCAEHLMRQRPAARIFMLEYLGVQSCADRIEGFLDTLGAEPDYQIVGRADGCGQLEVGTAALQRQIARRGAPDVIMAVNDQSAMGAMAVLEQAGLLQSTLVYGVDGAPDAKNLVSEGMMTATVAQFPTRIGQATAETVYKILEGRPYDTEIVIPVELVTRDNVAAFGTDFWQ